MTIDTTVLDTAKAVASDLAWSLEDDDDQQDRSSGELPGLPDQAERYGWGVVWRRAVLLVVVAAALAAGLVFVMRDRHALAADTAVTSAPTTTQDHAPEFDTTVTVTAPPSETVAAAPSQTPAPLPPPRVDPDTAFLTALSNHGIKITSTTEEVIGGGHSTCAYIAAGHTPQQTIEVVMHNSSLTLEEARDYFDAAINAYCP